MAGNTVGGWSPYKGGKPADPAPLGAMPKYGHANPRFPTFGPKEVAVPTGGYQSIIDASPPLNQGDKNKIADVKTPFRSTRKTAGDQSRQSFLQSLALVTGNQMRRGADTLNVNTQRQAEKTRAEDFNAQRGNATDRYGMDKGIATYAVDTRTRFSEGIKDGSQNFETEKRNEQAKRTAMILQMLGGLMGMI
jgi:hypothetical protein